MRRTSLALSLAAAATALATIAAPAMAYTGTPEVVSGSDRYQTAALISKKLDGTATNRIFLVTGTNYPDAISASGVASSVQGRVLLTEKDHLPEYVTDELTRLKRSNSAPFLITVVGGEGTISKAVFDQASQYGQTVRVAGSDRYETSALLAEKYLDSEYNFSADPTALFFATGSNYPDALSGAALAGSFKGSVMLVTKDGIPAKTRELLATGNLKDVRTYYVLGNESAVGQQVIDQLKALHPTANVVRLGGSDRYDTATKVANYFQAQNKFGSASNRVIATGANFPDALAAAVLANAQFSPLLLTNDNVMPASTRGYVDNLGYNLGRYTLIGKVNASVFNG